MDLEKLLSNLERNGFHALYFETAAEAADYITAHIKGKTVGIGGSLTVEQMGLFELLSEENTVYWHWRQDRKYAQKQAANTEVYLASANAIAESGEIVNIDGQCNRISSMMYGHEELFIVAGVNKITPDLASAVDRARNYAAPMNARRLHRKTPCVMSEPMKCHDCRSPDRLCRNMAITLHKSKAYQEAHVILIGETLGY